MAPKAKQEEKPKKAAPAKEPKEPKEAKEPGSGKEERPTKPDDAEFEKKLNVVKEKIDGLKAKQQKLSDEINAKNTGKEDYESKRQGLYDELAAVKQEKEEKMVQLKGLKDSEAERRREERDAKKSMNTLEKSLSSEEDIDKQIQEHEYKMSTTTMSLKDEKALMQAIKKLKATRPEVQRKVKEYEQMKAKCESSVQTSGMTVREQIDQLQKEFSEKAEKHSEIYNKIKELKEKRTLEMGDVTSLIEKKQAFKKDIMDLQEERNVIWTEKKEMMRVYNEWDKKQRLTRRKEMEAQWAAEQSERLAKQAEWELEKPNPFLDETTLLEQTIDYCKNLIGEEKKEEEKKVDASDWKAPVEGAMVMMAKKDRDAEFYLVPTKGKKGLKGKKQSEDGADTKGKKIKHTADTFKIFEQVKLPAPMTTLDVPSLIEKLEKSLGELNVKVKNWEESRKKKIEDAKKNAVAVEEKEKPAEKAAKPAEKAAEKA